MDTDFSFMQLLESQDDFATDDLSTKTTDIFLMNDDPSFMDEHLSTGSLSTDVFLNDFVFTTDVDDHSFMDDLATDDLSTHTKSLSTDVFLNDFVFTTDDLFTQSTDLAFKDDISTAKSTDMNDDHYVSFNDLSFMDEDISTLFPDDDLSTVSPVEVEVVLPATNYTSNEAKTTQILLHVISRLYPDDKIIFDLETIMVFVDLCDAPIQEKRLATLKYVWRNKCYSKMIQYYILSWCDSILEGDVDKHVLEYKRNDILVKDRNIWTARTLRYFICIMN
ncbi:hypothetical protein DFJ73DRAFT_769836 [Zopfochytrium polystomum]|nr:hypothetical protein DFJ73DRAFT_769836 [Zopfochytrium polystomum]